MRLLGHSVSLIASFDMLQNELIVADAFIRDELSKGRYDPAISKICFEILLELFGRTLKLDLGPHDGVEQKIEDVC
jgi:hypothetical protein